MNWDTLSRIWLVVSVVSAERHRRQTRAVEEISIGIVCPIIARGHRLRNLLAGYNHRVAINPRVGWMPFLLEALEYQLSEFNSKMNFLHSPHEYFRRNMYACFWFERRDLSHLVRSVGVDNVMFETDFPHPTCLYPHPLEFIAQGLAGLDDASREKVMSSNAAKLYRIPLA